MSSRDGCERERGEPEKNRAMNRYRKKPVVIEAVQWNESMATFKALEAKGMKLGGYNGHRDRPDECRNLRIQTLEGSMRVDPGDWIIKGVKGEFYPCKPDIFAATYDAAPEESLR